MKIHFYGACEMVTGSCFILETEDFRLLVDCGLFQGSKIVKELNYGEFSFDPRTIDAVILTHAHTDHSGLIPKLVKNGYSGPIYATRETTELCAIMFPDSGYIQEMEVERKNRKLSRANAPLLTPIYTAEDGHKAMDSFIPINYDESLLLNKNITAVFHDAGHILGSAHVLIEITEGDRKTKVLFSGDVGSFDQPYIEDPSIIDQADIIIIETTYGNRVREGKTNRLELLAEAINDGYSKGGKIIIPAFAVERTQDLLYYLNILQLENKIPIMPIYIDSPLAVAATKVFTRNTHNFDEETAGLIEDGNNPLTMENLKFSVTTADSIALNNSSEQAIIISASGMADAGRIKHHLKHNLWRSNATVIFVGYQAEGSLGRRLIDGANEVTIHGERICVNANIVNLLGFSGHADRNELLAWVKKAGNHAHSIVLVHGETDSIQSFAQVIEEELGKKAIIPELGEQIEFKQDEIVRIKPEVPWLEEIANKLALPTHLDKDAVCKIRDSQIKSKTSTSYKDISLADINNAYNNLRKNLKSIVNKAKKEKDYSYLMEMFARFEKILQESFYK